QEEDRPQPRRRRRAAAGLPGGGHHRTAPPERAAPRPLESARRSGRVRRSPGPGHERRRTTAATLPEPPLVIAGEVGLSPARGREADRPLRCGGTHSPAPAGGAAAPAAACVIASRDGVTTDELPSSYTHPVRVSDRVTAEHWVLSTGYRVRGLG